MVWNRRSHCRRFTLSNCRSVGHGARSLGPTSIITCLDCLENTTGYKYMTGYRFYNPLRKRKWLSSHVVFLAWTHSLDTAVEYGFAYRQIVHSFVSILDHAYSLLTLLASLQCGVTLSFVKPMLSVFHSHEFYQQKPSSGSPASHPHPE